MIAILLLEEKSKQNIKNDIKIFATDIDEEAISVARRGVYPSSIAKEVPDEYLEKYFVETSDEIFRIKSHVRELISFAHQNIATDPPFNKMHLPF